MPSWKKNVSGQRGRRPDYDNSFEDLPNREAALDRIERLTQTATALGSARDYQSAGQGNDDLDAVADELDRLLSDRGDAAPARQQRSRQTTRQTDLQRAPRQRPASAGGIEDVMGALDRLDEQVQGLSNSRAPAHDVRPARPQPGRYAMDRLRDEVDNEVNEPLGDRYGYSARDESDAYDPDDFDPVRDYGHRRAQSARAQRDATMHVYKDLGRRIDALRAPQEQALNQVREELGSLRDALGGLSRGTNETVGRQNAELRRLAGLVERLRNDKQSEQHALEIRQEVADLKAMVGRTNVEGALETLEHGYSHILQRLDELSRASLDPRVLHGVTVRLNEIEDAFSALPRSEHLLVLEDRVVEIAGRMEELLQRKTNADIAPLRSELQEVRGFIEQIDIKGLVEGIDDRMQFVSGRLDDLEQLAREQRGLDKRLSEMEQRMPAAETISRLQGRLEDIAGMMADKRAAPADHEHLHRVDQRLNDIVDRLERMEQAEPLEAPDAKVFQALEQRLETISGKIDVIEKKASRPVPIIDAAAMKAGGGTDGKFMAQLQDRLNDLTARLEEPRDTVTTDDLDKLRQEIGAMRESVSVPASTAALEQRISDLAHVVTQGGEGFEDGRIEQLGMKVAALAEQIEATTSNALSLDQLAPVLDRIENGLQQTRSDVSSIAKQAAEEVIQNSPQASQGEYDAAISELQNDLKRLLDAAEGSDERTKNTFDSVKSVLGSVTERLDNLEKAEVRAAHFAEPSQPAEASSGPVVSFPQEANADWKNVYDRPGNLARAKAEIPAKEELELDANPQDRQRSRKADFIAAARRAAQAASAEAELLEKKQRGPFKSNEKPEEERGKARVGWLKNVLKRDKADTGEKAEPEAAENGKPEPAADALELTQEQIQGQPQTDGAPVLPGDRPAPEASQGGGRKSRAVLYAAAAVVLLIGTLQVFRTVTSAPEGPDQVAATAQSELPVSQEAGSLDTVKAPVSADATSAPPMQETPSGTAAAPPAGAAPVADAAPTKVGMSPQAQAQTAASTAPMQPRTQVPSQQDVQTAAASTTLSSGNSLAFTPPSGAAGSFTDQGPKNSEGFAPAISSSGSSSGDLLAGLPPEEVGPLPLRSAAASGNPAAEFLVGVNYTEGNGVTADLEKAALWYQKAADKGLAPAQYRLASLYEKGRGVERDLPKAKAWYGKAAEAGNTKAMHNLAVLYAEGAGDQPDYAKAAKWFEAAANFGVKDSLFNLGILYAGGIGVDKDLVASYKWFAIAADQGDPEAAKRRDDVANMMDQEMLANARLAVETFSVKPSVPAANKVTLEPDWAESNTLKPQAASVAAPQVVDQSAMIREAQDKLNYLGFDTGTPDGQMGPRTRSAIRAFQRSLGLAETGEVDSKLIEELKSQAI